MEPVLIILFEEKAQRAHINLGHTGIGKVFWSRILLYSTKSRLPKSLIGLKFYLSAPILWKLIGKQAFIRAEKQDS